MSEADWEERISKQHRRPYYYNIVTQKSEWVDPRPAIRAAAAAAASGSSAAVPNTSTPAPAVVATVQSQASEEPRKRARHEETTSADVVTSSYKPPVSGAAVDAALINSAKRPFPRIQPTLPPCPAGKDMWTREDIQVNEVLRQTYLDGSIVDSKGVKQKFKDITNPLQARHIYNLIKDNKYTHTLEVGFAMGASACWITQAHKENGLNGHHVAIDPNQTKQYENIGRYLVDKCGNSSFMEVMEMTSYRALPMLFERVRSGEIPKFDLIYIDGWHTFDYTLVDFFYADLLLNVHGVIVLDDVKHKPVRRCFDYIVNNYNHFQLIKKTPAFDEKDSRIGTSQATFVKVAEDTRTWNHHVDF